MTRDDARLHRLLDEERIKLEADLEYLKTLEYKDISSSNHLADDATAAFDQASDQALLRQTQHRLSRVDRALAKLAEGDYGYCEGCGEAIDFARLKALPDARFCLTCQRKREVSGTIPPGPRAFEEGRLDNGNSKEYRT
ncbi:MAG: TraR/DksA family transcriptional regulator [Proteobacteria bacterium]|nr:TraR/DksA family transcriptional regulator [Pseudomonadota bacterium]